MRKRTANAKLVLPTHYQSDLVVGVEINKATADATIRTVEQPRCVKADNLFAMEVHGSAVIFEINQLVTVHEL